MVLAFGPGTNPNNRSFHSCCWERVGLNGGQFGGLGVFLGDAELFSFDGGPDGLIPDFGIFTGLFKFEGIIFRAEWIVATAINMNAIGDFVVVQPKIIFVHDGFVGAESKLGCGFCLLEKGVGKKARKLTVAQVVQEGSVHGVRFAVGVPSVGGAEGIDEQNFVLLGDLTHSFHVKDQVGVLPGSGSYAGYGLKGSR